MAIVRYGSGDRGLAKGEGALPAKRPAKKAAKAAKKAALKHVAKHAAKHALKKTAKKAAKHAAKHAGAEKQANKRAQGAEPEQQDGVPGEELAKAYHHLRRAGAVISLMGPESGGDLKALYEAGVNQYREAAAAQAKGRVARAARQWLRAVEHLALAGLYSARKAMLVEVPAARDGGSAKQLDKLRGRLERLKIQDTGEAGRLQTAAWELLRRATDAEDDAHLQHELTRAVDGLCAALEEGV